MSDSVASGSSGDTTGSSSLSADANVTHGPKGPSVESLLAKYGHLSGDGEDTDAGEGSEGESNSDAEGPVKPPAEAKVIPPVPYAEFMKSRRALQQARAEASRQAAQNELLMSQFEALQQAIQNGGKPVETEPEETDVFRDPEIEALKAQIAELAEGERARRASSLASQMEQEWQSAIQQHPHIADAGELVLTLMRADETLTVTQAVSKLLRIAPAPASTPSSAPKVAPTNRTPATPPIRTLPSNGGGLTVPAVEAPKSFGDISKTLLAKYGGR